MTTTTTPPADPFGRPPRTEHGNDPFTGQPITPKPTAAQAAEAERARREATSQSASAWMHGRGHKLAEPDRTVEQVLADNNAATQAETGGMSGSDWMRAQGGPA